MTEELQAQTESVREAVIDLATYSLQIARNTVLACGQHEGATLAELDELDAFRVHYFDCMNVDRAAAVASFDRIRLSMDLIFDDESVAQYFKSLSSP